MVVLSVTVMLTAMMFPAYAGLRRNAERVVSASNMRQVGMAMTIYANEYGGALPYSALARVPEGRLVQEMMATHLGPDVTSWEDEALPLYAGHKNWEGLGNLISQAYLYSPEVLYCPAHRGDHEFSRYERQYFEPTMVLYSNYQYRGDIDIFTGRRLTLDRDAHRVMLTDGMRTRRDFNHQVGYNSLLGDGSVFWRFDGSGEVFNRLPEHRVDAIEAAQIYQEVWDIIDN